MRRRGSSAADSGARARRSPIFVLALIAALIASAALAVSAGAQVVSITTSTGPGVNGIGLTTETDTSPVGYTQPPGYSAPTNDGLGVPAGAIKHVWVIILENHAFETNFTGLDDNSYMSKVLPQDGALLTNYYGTGHSSLDNYTSFASGQGPLTDDQADGPAYNLAAGSISTAGGSLTANGNYGQFSSAAGANAPAGDNGSVYPSTVPTLFNQLDANKTSWKVYAQDLDYGPSQSSSQSAPPTGQNAGQQYCGAPDATVGPTPSASQTTNPATTSPIVGGSSATDADQYVAKHNPLPWFASMINSGDCTSSVSTSKLVPLFGANDQLYANLQNESTTPSFSFIVPNNCSNGHDSMCYGNNLSGGFGGANGQVPNAAINRVGGAYAADLFLEHTIPEIMKSPAYSDGGLISVIWDEAYPQFTYSNDSYANSAVSNGTAYNSLNIDEAGETLFGRSLNWEPTGPNTPNVYSQFGQELAGGPGYNAYLDRPGNDSVPSSATTTVGSVTSTYSIANAVTNSVSTSTSPGGLVACTGGTTSGNGFYTMPRNGCYAGSAHTGAGGSAATTAAIQLAAGSSQATENVGSSYSAGGLISVKDSGQQVNFPINAGVVLSDGSTSNYTGPVYVGQVSASLPADLPADDTTGAGGTDTSTTSNVNDGPVVTFQLVDGAGNPVTVNNTFNGTIYLSGETAANDPLYDAFDGTSGGGDTGAIMLSPYIKGGTVSNTYYNHYSLLRSLEDIFDTAGGSGSAPGYTGSINVSTGVDGNGHIGYAAQPGLTPLGTDVFTNSPYLSTSTATTTSGFKATVTHDVTRTVNSVRVYVPHLTGLSLAQAKGELSSAGLKLGKVSAPRGRRGYTLVVRKQSAPAGREAKKGAKVNLTLALRKG